MNKPGSPATRPTMEMVAELAEVSKITVSRALRGSELVRPHVRERVAEAAKQLGYRVNVAARSLRTRPLASDAACGVRMVTYRARFAIRHRSTRR